ncbi:MAG: hypothetical protein ACOZF0_09710 [Thermodesulfobacteriota bacterium]
MKSVVGLLVGVMWCISAGAFAEEKIMTAEYTVELGENDSRNDARRICFLEAKHLLLESVGFHLRKSAVGDDHWFDQEDMDTYSSLLLKIETAGDFWQLEEGRMKLTLSIRAAVDPDYIGRRIKEIKADEELQKKIRADRLRLRETEEKYKSIHSELALAEGEKALVLRKKRQALARQMDELEKIQYLIEVKTKTADELIRDGMTMNEVIAVAGQPRATTTCEYPDFMNYGDIWIILRDGIVVGRIPMEKWAGACHQYEQGNGAAVTPVQGAKRDAAAEAEENKYEIILKNGQRIQTPTYERIDDVIYYKRFDGIIGIEESKVQKIDELQ